MARVGRALGVVLVGVFALLATASSVPAAGQTGDGEGAGLTWRQLSAGSVHTCAVATSGSLYCWGYNVYGAVGVGAGPAIVHSPVEIGGPPQDWASVSSYGYADEAHSCAVTTSGRLFCWGADTHAQLGDDADLEDQFTPVEVAGGSSRWASVSAGDRHTCALRTSGRLYCWGDNWAGQVGDGSGEPFRPTPVEVAGRTADWAAVSAGGDHTCARKKDRRLFCWGGNGERQLGDGTELGRRRPREVAGRTADWANVSASHRHTCARKVDRRLFCWGDNFTGQLGNGRTSASGSALPVEVAGHTTDWASVATGDWHTCARKVDRRLFCWGRDGPGGALGNNPAVASRTSPVQVAGAHADWALVDGGAFHTCAIRGAQQLFCWGSSVLGVLGNDDGGDQATPAEIVVP